LPFFKIELRLLSLLFLFFLSAKAQTAVAVLRYYNSKRLVHFYTTSGTEITPGRDGWTQEGDLGNLYNSQIGSPVYRLYNTSTGAHYYTKNISGAPGGFHSEGILGYETMPPLITYGNTKAVYEFYSAGSHDYFYSTTSTTPGGYQSNGIAFYVF
jgi:hypothetical protein